MQFQRVNVTFYDVVNMIHDVIRTADLFPYTAKFMFVRDGINETQTMKDKQNTHVVLSYVKVSTSAGRNDDCLAKARKISILPTSLDI